jgi:hypothetical protein
MSGLLSRLFVFVREIQGVVRRLFSSFQILTPDLIEVQVPYLSYVDWSVVIYGRVLCFFFNVLLIYLVEVSMPCFLNFFSAFRVDCVSMFIFTNKSFIARFLSSAAVHLRPSFF